MRFFLDGHCFIVHTNLPRKIFLYSLQMMMKGDDVPASPPSPSNPSQLQLPITRGSPPHHAQSPIPAIRASATAISSSAISRPQSYPSLSSSPSASYLLMAFSFGEEDDDDGDDELDQLDEDRLAEHNIGGGTLSSCAGCVPSTTTCADLSSPLAFALCASFICSILSGVAYLFVY